MDRDALIRRGQGADKLLSDPIVMQALGDMEAELFTQWSQTNPVNVDGREAIFRQVKAIEYLQTALEKYRSDGITERANAERDARDRSGISNAA